MLHGYIKILRNQVKNEWGLYIERANLVTQAVGGFIGVNWHVQYISRSTSSWRNWVSHWTVGWCTVMGRERERERERGGGGGGGGQEIEQLYRGEGKWVQTSVPQKWMPTFSSSSHHWRRLWYFSFSPLHLEKYTCYTNFNISHN